MPLRGQIIPLHIGLLLGDVHTVGGDIVLDPFNEVLEIILVGFESGINFDGNVIEIIVVRVEWSSFSPQHRS